MDDDSVRKALDQVDALQWRARAAGAVGVVLVVFSIWWFRRVVASNADLEVVVEYAVQAVIVTILAASFMVMFWVTQMTRRILTAVQLSAARLPGPPPR